MIMKQIESISYSMSESEILSKINDISDSIVDELGWAKKVAEAKGRAGDELSFRRWIWREVDGLQVVRYLNEHQKRFGSELIISTAAELLKLNGYNGCTTEPQLVLKEIKRLDRRVEVRKVY